MSGVQFDQLSAVVIDDQDAVRGMVRGLLRKLGLTTIELGKDVADGLGVIAKTRPDFVLLDINMPGRNGLELVRDVRAGLAQPIRRDLPIALLTGHTDQAIVGTALALDANAFIAKPVSAKVLGERIERMFTRPVPIREASVYASLELPDFGLPLPPGALVNAGVVLKPSLPERGPAEVLKDLIAIEAGTVLSRPLRGSSGHLLLAAGQSLSASMIDRLSDLAELDETLRSIWVLV